VRSLWSSTRSERGGRPRSDSSDESGRSLMMVSRAAVAAQALSATRTVEDGPR
jgi:hypothetical protein